MSINFFLTSCAKGTKPNQTSEVSSHGTSDSKHTRFLINFKKQEIKRRLDLLLWLERVLMCLICVCVLEMFKNCHFLNKNCPY